MSPLTTCQPWRASQTIINLFLTGKTSGLERPRAPVLQIPCGVVKSSHIDYAVKECWEILAQSIPQFPQRQEDLAHHAQGKEESDSHPPYPNIHTQASKESSEAPPLAKRAKAGKVVKKRTVKSSKGPLPCGIMETEYGKLQPLLPEVPGMGKEKVGYD
ncbi:hypothetical protein Tco_0619520 [Tanacetum coccineum]